jgi:hypothetical protein
LTRARIILTEPQRMLIAEALRDSADAFDLGAVDRKRPRLRGGKLVRLGSTRRSID